MQIRVLLIHESPLLGAALRALLETQAQLEVIGLTPAASAALGLARATHPHIVLLDLAGAASGWLDLIPALLDVSPSSRVLVLLPHDDLELQRQAVRRGALGVVCMSEVPERLFRAITKVHAGEVWLSRAALADVLTHLHAPRPVVTDPEAQKLAALTPREREVIALLGTGLKNKPLAESLAITETTVRHHLTAIFTKLGVTDRVELIIYAYRYGLARPLV